MSFKYSSCFSFSSPNIRSLRTSEKPMMAFRGVRSSCDMLARNSDLCELAALVLDLQEQTGVLNRQGGLGRKRPQKFDDRRRKSPGDLADYGQAAEQVILAHKRHSKQSPISGAHESATHPALGRRCQYVGDLVRLVYLREPPGRAFPFSDWRRKHRLYDVSLELLGGSWYENLAL